VKDVDVSLSCAVMIVLLFLKNFSCILFLLRKSLYIARVRVPMAKEKEAKERVAKERVVATAAAVRTVASTVKPSLTLSIESVFDASWKVKISMRRCLPRILSMIK